MSPTSYRAAPSRGRATELLHPALILKEDVGFEPTHAFTRLTVFKTVPFSRTWVILQGGCGIRTHARFYTPDGFQDRSLQPDLGNPPKTI